MHYSTLDPRARYKVRVVYAGDKFDVPVRLVASSVSTDKDTREIEVHPFISKPQPVAPIEVAIPIEATASGELTLSWHCDPKRGGAGRGCQIAEVWLIKVRPK
jgi:hypothetical protein